MNKFAIAVILACYCVWLAQPFLLSHKFKDGCDPNPCKHGGTCRLTDPTRNKNKSECTCKSGYWGPQCESRTGCSHEPCKHKAQCTNRASNLSDYTCKCTGNYVGKNCQEENHCLAKNPCKNDAKCDYDLVSGKTVCKCKPGWGSKHCDKKECNITEVKLKSVTKNSPKLYMDMDVAEKMKAIDDLAKMCKVHLEFKKSFIKHPDKTKAYAYDFKDKTNPNHFIGHAFCVNFYDTKDKLLCNDICLGKTPNPVPEVSCFLKGLSAPNLKWSILDACTIHTNWYNDNTLKYNKKREAFQVGCADKKFS